MGNGTNRISGQHQYRAIMNTFNFHKNEERLEIAHLLHGLQVVTITSVFQQSKAKQLSEAQLLAAGITHKQLDIAVRNEEVRKGLTGYWLPRPADPGAAAVMRRAMRVTEEQEQA